jgi:AraC family transcriptional regulator
MSGPTTSSARPEYEKRVNRVVDHIREHLADELTLADLARVAAFSPFHSTGCSRRSPGRRCSGSSSACASSGPRGALSSHPDQSVLAAALDHGFSSAAAFARAFRGHFEISATEWRAGGAERWHRRQAQIMKRLDRNRRQPIRKRGKAGGRRLGDTPRKRTGEAAMNVRVAELPACHVAYMRYVGPYGAHGIPDLWKKFRKWMETHDLISDRTVMLGIAYDDPDVTAPDRCRYDACVVVPADFKPDRWVNVTDVAGGKFAVSEFAGSAHEIRGAWEALYRLWLPGSGYEPDARPCFELYRNRVSVEGKPDAFRCELCMPVRPL